MLTELGRTAGGRFWKPFTEDWWTVLLGAILLGSSVIAAGVALGPWVPELDRWQGNPLEGVRGAAVFADAPDAWGGFVSLLALGVTLGTLGMISLWAMGASSRRFPFGFAVVFALAVLAYLAANHDQVDYWGFGYAFWALVFGLAVSNLLGTPPWLRSAVRTELYIKTGLVLLGAEILFGRLLALGVPGLVVAWVVTPIVLVSAFAIGMRVLRLRSRSLCITISAATAVCGVSAAIAAAAASRARREELTLAVGMTLIFTVVMMVGMPALIRAVGMDDVVGGAWMGGTIDSTGAVVAAGAMLGEQAGEVAAVVKMIQNLLIGMIAFFIALYWVVFVEHGEGERRASPKEIWTRLPKFVIGFLGASLVFSFLLLPALGEDIVNGSLAQSAALRGWLFCLAFVSIGLETNFRQLTGQMGGGKPLYLYLIAQSFNLLLTLLMAWLAFGLWFSPADGG